MGEDGNPLKGQIINKTEEAATMIANSRVGRRRRNTGKGKPEI